ncbi:MAG: AMP-binding protein [Oscillospiraceae bacterium]|nr:AMP-binding protein [Oscillospiraceae bacterium]
MKKICANPVDYFDTVNDMIENIPNGIENEPAISWFTRKGEEKGVSYGKLREDVRSLKAVMMKKELQGKHIAILGENSYEWLLVYFAATCSGAVAVCVDVEQSNETIIQMLEMTDVDCLFFTPSLDSICLPFADKGMDVFRFSGKGIVPTVAELLEEGAELIRSGMNCESKSGPDDTATIVFTSGTTSYSKPVMLSHRAILTNAADAAARVALGRVTFSSLPFYHTYGMTCSVIGALLEKCHVYINGNLKTVMRDMQAASAHSLFTVPLMLETIHKKMWAAAAENKMDSGLRKLLKLNKIKISLGMTNMGKKTDEIREKCFGSVRLIICGAAHLSKEIMEDLTCLGILVLQGYGITECSPLVSVNCNKANRFSSVGLVMPNCEISFRDEEILVRGANVMQGYYKLDELTEEAFVDGWFATGDLGYQDKDGFLYITGRKKNLIVFKNGKKMSPEKLEEKLGKIPMIKDVVVYGAVSGNSSDDVQVAISVFPNAEKTEGMSRYEILDALQNEINTINSELPLYQQIQMVNIRESEFSKTALQKIKRHLV